MKPIGFIDPDANWELIPEHCHDALEGYVLYGRNVGDFLTAVLSNDLRGSVDRADHINQHALPRYVQFLYNYAPANCWGSPQNYRDWLQRGFEAREIAAGESK